MKRDTKITAPGDWRSQRLPLIGDGAPIRSEPKIPDPPTKGQYSAAFYMGNQEEADAAFEQACADWIGQVYGQKSSRPVEHKSWRGVDADVPRATAEAARQDVRDYNAAERFARQLEAQQNEIERLEKKARLGGATMAELWRLHAATGYTASGIPLSDDSERINRAMNAIYELLDEAHR